MIVYRLVCNLSLNTTYLGSFNQLVQLSFERADGPGN